jgi:TctA family transporter
MPMLRIILKLLRCPRAESVMTLRRWLSVIFALASAVCLKPDCELAPLILGFVLGPLMEENLRRALLISRGDLTVLVREPLSLAFLIAAALLLTVVAAPAIRRKREEALQE